MTQKNPLLDDLSDKMPGVSILLPTQGQFYGPGVLAEGVDAKEEIDVGTLTLMDEVRYRDPFLLASGRAVRDMIRRLCPVVVDPDRLLDVDVEAILLAARIASYGDIIEVEVSCSNPETIDLLDPDTNEPTGEKKRVCDYKGHFEANLIDLMTNYAPMEDMERFDHVLQPWGHKISFKPLSHSMALHVTKLVMQRQREIASFQNVDDDQALFDKDAMEAYVRAMTTTMSMTLDMLADTIFKVTTKDGQVIDDQGMISEWLARLPKNRVDEINDASNKLLEFVRGLSMLGFTCPECGHDQKVPLVLDADRLFLSAAATSKPEVNTSNSSEPSETLPTKPRKRSHALPTTIKAQSPSPS